MKKTLFFCFSSGQTPTDLTPTDLTHHLVSMNQGTIEFEEIRIKLKAFFFLVSKGIGLLLRIFFFSLLCVLSLLVLPVLLLLICVLLSRWPNWQIMQILSPPKLFVHTLTSTYRTCLPWCLVGSGVSSTSSSEDEESDA